MTRPTMLVSGMWPKVRLSMTCVRSGGVQGGEGGLSTCRWVHRVRSVAGGRAMALLLQWRSPTQALLCPQSTPPMEGTVAPVGTQRHACACAVLVEVHARALARVPGLACWHSQAPCLGWLAAGSPACDTRVCAPRACARPGVCVFWGHMQARKQGGEGRARAHGHACAQTRARARARARTHAATQTCEGFRVSLSASTQQCPGGTSITSSASPPPPLLLALALLLPWPAPSAAPPLPLPPMATSSSPSSAATRRTIISTAASPPVPSPDSGEVKATTSPTSTVRGEGRGMARTTSFSTASLSSSAALFSAGAMAAPAMYTTLVICWLYASRNLATAEPKASLRPPSPPAALLPLLGEEEEEEAAAPLLARPEAAAEEEEAGGVRARMNSCAALYSLSAR